MKLAEDASYSAPPRRGATGAEAWCRQALARVITVSELSGVGWSVLDERIWRTPGTLIAVSDFAIRLIPAGKNWQPSLAAAAAAADYVTGLFSGDDGDVEEVSSDFYDQVTVIDAGENTTRITCARCGGDILEWFFDLIEEHGESIGDREMIVPCCGATVPLDAHGYDWPVGFARFEMCAMNPTRSGYELDAQELARVADILGHPVIQILAHY